MEFAPFIFILLGIVFVVVITAANASARKRRRLAMANLASELEYAFHPARDRRLDEELRGFDLFDRGHSRVATNTIRGEALIAGRRYGVRMGDYRYTVGSGKNSRTHRTSYLSLTLPHPTPGLRVRREHTIDRLAGAVGFDDIDFESEAFSRAFFVKSPNRRFAYDVIDPRMMEFLLGSSPPTIEIRGARCVINREDRRWPPAQFRRELGWLAAFFERWPDHVTRTLDQYVRS